MAKFLTRFSGNNTWMNILTDYHPVTGDKPTVTTDDANPDFAGRVDMVGTVVSEGDSPITSYGFVWADHDDPKKSDNTVEVGTGTFTGEFTERLDDLPLHDTLYFAAYATNSFGTSYGSTIPATPMICLMAGTPITLANGVKKNIEEIRYDDLILVWNFDSGVYDQAKPVWMVQPFEANNYGLVRFSDGSSLGTVNDGRGHRIFNIQKGKFTFMMNEDTPLGTMTYKENGMTVSVISKEVVKSKTTFYNLITDGHFNAFADSILTSTGLNNLYPITNMKFVKSNRELRSREEFPEISDELFNGLRLAEQPVNYPDLHEKIIRISKRQL